ncbi:MAG TPA: retropepsin-like aspartic protease [Candidatus Omnitrophota bacterium]|nr:retropepsin-like aspartic protease [Candidatus Omnitrophota bacterium]HPT38705.1 retropepsin-like aspartic protease [Candidatus Omnitrophota bacterium]
MKNRLSFTVVLIFLIFLGFKPAAADILYLKNGRSLEGIITKENDQEVSLSLGSGWVKFSKDQIASIKKSSPEGTQLIKEGWAKEKEAQAARTQELKELKEHEPKPVVLDKQNGQVTVEALLNKKVKARLVLDTGASFVALSSKIASSLGVDLAAGDDIELILADGRKVNAKRIILSSLNVQGAEIENIEAAVLPSQQDSLLIQDGLLGMSFLKNFNFKVDQRDGKLILEKL